jgi:hypothetical protein
MKALLVRSFIYIICCKLFHSILPKTMQHLSKLVKRYEQDVFDEAEEEMAWEAMLEERRRQA